MYCPDGAISEDLDVDLDFCKGCGICANECPKKAITMVREEK
jgi:pyruvate ferredoxin oxidoreductase delta subunit